MERAGGSGVVRIVIGLLVLGAVWFGLGRVRARPAPPTPATSASAPVPVLAPPRPTPSAEADRSRFFPRLEVPPDASRLVVAGPDFRALAVAGDSLVTVEPDRSSAAPVLMARAIAGGVARQLADLPREDLPYVAAIGGAIVWTPSSGTDARWIRSVESIRVDGTGRRTILPAASMGAGLWPAGPDLVFVHGDKLWLLGADLRARALLSTAVPGRVDDAPERDQKLTAKAIGEYSTLGGDRSRIWWTTRGNPIDHQPSRFGSIARSGGALDLELAAPEDVKMTLLGVAGDRVFFATSLDGGVAMRAGGVNRHVEGDAGGLNGGARVAGGDLYVRLSRLVDRGVVQNVVVRIRSSAPRVEPLVEAFAFDVAGDTLYFVAKDGIRAMPR